jgi:hypothetical protein
MRLTTDQRALLVALQQGDRLKVHRTLDGAKSYRLHRLDNSGSTEVDGALVDSLVRAGLIESNLKFPAAAFLLTDKGAAAVAPLTGKLQAPAGARHFA